MLLKEYSKTKHLETERGTLSVTCVLCVTETVLVLLALRADPWRSLGWSRWTGLQGEIVWGRGKEMGTSDHMHCVYQGLEVLKMVVCIQAGDPA